MVNTDTSITSQKLFVDTDTFITLQKLNVLFFSLETVLRDLSWIWFIKLSDHWELNIYINGQ